MSVQEILSGYNESFSQILKLHSSIYVQAEQVIFLSRDTLKELQEVIVSRNFKSIEEEIYFFKVMKQKPLSNLVYFTSLLDFENQFPRSGYKYQEEYIHEYLKILNRFFLKNKGFIEYLNSERDYQDKQFFTRLHRSRQTHINCETHYTNDNFCTPKDYTLAKYTAYLKLINYIEKRLNHCKLLLTASAVNKSNTFSLKWTSSKTDLTELIYALHSAHTINNGNIEIKEIAQLFSELFQFELGDFYKIYSEIKKRKIQRTKFLNNLSRSLIVQMENSES